ncbi:unnamed protein product [Ectocarpus sp. 8 AP-2014]
MSLATTTPRCEEFAQAIGGLNAAYLTRIKAQIIKWVQNLRAQHLEVQLDAEGHYVTTLPDDMFNLINMQVSRQQVAYGGFFEANAFG